MAKDSAKAAAQPAATTTSKPKETAPAAAESAPAATESAPAAAESAPAAKPSGGGGGSRPISYFSSVSTDEYRSGWNAIFGQTNGAATPKRTRKPKLPATLEISLDDLDADARAALEGAMRRLARKRRLDYDALAEAGRVQWSIACTLSE